MTTITLRPATADDRNFIDGLSPRLSGVPRPAWHDLAAMERFQDRHMAVSFGAATLIVCAEDGGRLSLLSLDVFADKKHAVAFYERRGFRCEAFRMVKPL